MGVFFEEDMAIALSIGQFSLYRIAFLKKANIFLILFSFL